MQVPKHSTTYSIFCRKTGHRSMNDCPGFTRKYTSSMKLTGLSTCCFWKVSAIKRCLPYWVSASQMSASKSIASKNNLLPNQKIMITMEFDEMKKIWDAQNNQPLYVIDEKALHNRIQSKMNTVLGTLPVSASGC